MKGGESPQAIVFYQFLPETDKGEKRFNFACSAYSSEAPQSGTSGRETKKFLPKRVQQPEIKVMEAKIPIVWLQSN
jgi:hypothetical protein